MPPGSSDEPVAAMSVIYSGVPERSFDAVMKEMFDDKNRFFYQSYFREPGVAEAVFDPNPRDFLRRFYFAISGNAKPGGITPTMVNVRRLKLSTTNARPTTPGSR